MATAAKQQKEKSNPSVPRILPRHTATSAARAAKNANNRNLLIPLSQRASPTRTQSKTKTANPIQIRTKSPKTDSKTDCRKAQPCNDEPEVTETGKLRQDVDNFLVNSNSVVEDSTTADILVLQDTSVCDDCALSTSIENEPQNEFNLGDDVNSKVSDAVSLCKSRPSTPATRSRPDTPKSRVATPPDASRPKTPSTPSRQTYSRPDTPQQRYGTETKMSSHPASPHGRNAAQTLSRSLVKDDDDTKSAYIRKLAQFQNMKKELDLKQQSILEMFDNLRDMSGRLAQEGSLGSGESFQAQELVVFNVGDWTSDEVAQLCRDAVSTASTDKAVDIINTTKPIDEVALEELDAMVMKVPSCFAELCLQAFTARQELIDWVKDLISQSVSQPSESECSGSLDRIAQYNAEGLQLCEALRDLKSRAANAVDTVTQLSRRACRERGILIAVGESLVREIARLRQDLEARAVIVNEMREIRAETETAKALEDTRLELEQERSARAALKEKLASNESQLRQTRYRVSKMDRQLREAEASIASFTGTVRTLEEQSRQKETQMEARARKLKESLKTGEVASNQIAQQRDALQNEVQSLKEQIESMTSQHKTSVQDLNKDIKELRNFLEEQRKLTIKENDLRKSLEKSLEEHKHTIEELTAKNTELENSRPNPELPTEREMDLWAELQATKETLHLVEDEMTTCKREKTRFLETLTKIAESENKVGMQQKLAAELLSKEEVVSKMQAQIRELTKNIKLNEQKVIQYESYVRDVQAHNRAVANCQEAPNGISYQDLQQEIMNLRMGLLEAVHRNEELTEMMAQKEQQIEQQEKTSRAQARVIKVREELINMLKNKETEQSRELTGLQQDLEHRMKIVEEVNKQIAAKAEEIQELFATLENKQQQIHRLEKIVLALEEQQRRAQAQRTRHEEKIATLEHELAANNGRGRKFLFF